MREGWARRVPVACPFRVTAANPYKFLNENMRRAALGRPFAVQIGACYLTSTVAPASSSCALIESASS